MSEWIEILADFIVWAPLPTENGAEIFADVSNVDGRLEHLTRRGSGWVGVTGINYADEDVIAWIPFSGWKYMWKNR